MQESLVVVLPSSVFRACENNQVVLCGIHNFIFVNKVERLKPLSPCELNAKQRRIADDYTNKSCNPQKLAKLLVRSSEDCLLVISIK